MNSNAVIASWSEYEKSAMIDLMVELGFEVEIPVICIDSFYSLKDDGMTVSPLDRKESRFMDQSNALKKLILNSKKHGEKGMEGRMEDILTLMEFSQEELKDVKQKNKDLEQDNFLLHKKLSLLNFVGKFIQGGL